jgi:flagellar protein FlbD
VAAKLPPISIHDSNSVLYKNRTKGAVRMIEVTRLNDKKLSINAELIERIEESPDTIITLTTGNKIIVKESRQEVKNLVILYKKEIYSREL